MGKSDIDKYFKDQLKGYSKEVDTDAIWSALDLQGQKKEKRKPVFAYLVGYSMLLIAAVGYFGYDSLDTQQKSQNAIKEDSKTQIDIQVDAITDDPIIKTSDALLQSSSATTALPNIGTKKKEIHNLLKNKSSSKTERTLVKNSTSIFSLPSEPNTSINKSVQENDQVGNTPFYENALHENYVVRNTPSNNKYTRSVQGLSVTEIKTNDTRHVVAPIALRQIKLLTVSKFIFSAKARKIDENEKPKKNNTWSLNIYSGVYAIDRKLRSRNTLPEPFLTSKEKIESPLELFSAGAQLKYNMGPVYLKSGIEFQSLNEQFKYDQHEVLDTITSSNIFSGNLREEVVLNSRWLHNNNHRLYTIPLSVGYEKRINNWYFSIEGNLSAILHRSFVGRQLNQAGMVISDFDDVNNSFRLGYGTSVGARYAFTNTISVYLRPHYFTFTDLYNSQLVVYTKKYDLYGLVLGLSFKL